MTKKNVQVLAAIVVGLVLMLAILETGDDTGTVPGGGRLLADLAPVANDVTEVTVAGADGSTTLARSESGWVVTDRHDYPADVGKLRQLVVALADATIVEAKTANPENHDRLGLVAPDEGGSGTRIVLAGDGFSHAVILGDTAQGDFRYARRAGEVQTYLVDRDPETPADPTEWLAADLVDIGADRVRRVSTTHADGETIVIEKETEEATNFVVRDVPEGRELSYAAVGNGIGAALASLELDDVRPAAEGEPDTTTVFETFDGHTITARVTTTDDATWVAFAAEPDVGGLNDRTAGWEYRVPEFKKNLLVRRWPDLLKAETTEAPSSD